MSELFEIDIFGFVTTMTADECRVLAARLLRLADSAPAAAPAAVEPPPPDEKLTQGRFKTWRPADGFGFVIADSAREKNGIYCSRSVIEGVVDDARLVPGARCKFSWIRITDGRFAGQLQVTRLVLL